MTTASTDVFRITLQKALEEYHSPSGISRIHFFSDGSITLPELIHYLAIGNQ